MTATNHALTGAAIGLLIGEPLIALPVAVASHFICDALPHYGRVGEMSVVLGGKKFRNYLIIDALLCFVLVVILAIIQPHNWLLAAFCAFLATAPDFGWINKFRKARQNKKWQPNLFTKFAGNIQWFQRPIGWVAEIGWAVATIAIITPFLVVTSG